MLRIYPENYLLSLISFPKYEEEMYMIGVLIELEELSIGAIVIAALGFLNLRINWVDYKYHSFSQEAWEL